MYADSLRRGARWLRKGAKHRGISTIFDPVAEAAAAAATTMAAQPEDAEDVASAASAASAAASRPSSSAGISSTEKQQQQRRQGQQKRQQKQQQYLVQRAVSPWLISGKMFDIGVYVAITSVEPSTRVYVYDDVLLRHCTRNYTVKVFEAEHGGGGDSGGGEEGGGGGSGGGGSGGGLGGGGSEGGGSEGGASYVVEDDYLPPWNVPALRRYYVWGMSTKSVLKAHLVSIGADPEAFFERIHAAAAEAATALAAAAAPATRRMRTTDRSAGGGAGVGRGTAAGGGGHGDNRGRDAGGTGHGDGTSNNPFFQLVRMDFIADTDLQPWLIEVNQSPNMSPSHFPDNEPMFQSLVSSLISLRGLLPHQLNWPCVAQHAGGGGGGAGGGGTGAEMAVVSAAYPSTPHIDVGYAVCDSCGDDCGGGGGAGGGKKGGGNNGTATNTTEEGEEEEEEVEVDTATRGYFTLARRCEAVCRRCRTPERTRIIREFVSENRGRGEFLRLVPSLSPALAAAQPTARDDLVLRSWMRIKCADDDAFCR